MSLTERIDQELAAARRRRDELAVTTLGLLKSEVVNASKVPGAGGRLADGDVIRIVRREVKRRQEAAAAFGAGGRPEAADREMREAALLESFLPPPLTDEEVDKVAREVARSIAASGAADFGRLMKALTARFAGEVEGGRLAAAARRVLGPS